MQRFMRGMGNGGAIAGREPLSDEAIKRCVPSVFAECPHESRSDRFAYIPTSAVLAGLRKEGFQPFFAQQGGSRIEGKQNFTKHMLRLRHQSRSNETGEAHEIILVNAHDGTSSYQMISGVFRFVCANGLMTGDTFGEVKVGHRGDAVAKVIEGAYTVLDDADRVMVAVDSMKAVRLDRSEQLALAKCARLLRFDDPEKAPIEPERLLWARRSADAGNDLWTCYNRIQENLVRGGQRGVVRDEQGRRRLRTVREIKGIDQKRSLNRALWTLAEEMERLKAA